MFTSEGKLPWRVSYSFITTVATPMSFTLCSWFIVRVLMLSVSLSENVFCSISCRIPVKDLAAFLCFVSSDYPTSRHWTILSAPVSRRGHSTACVWVPQSWCPCSIQYSTLCDRVLLVFNGVPAFQRGLGITTSSGELEVLPLFKQDFWIWKQSLESLPWSLKQTSIPF